jgi:N-acyl-D-aspartate/D-glutamate deacylase
MYDLVFAGGTVIDGTGRPAFAADVAVNNDRIVGVGTLTGESARRRIDARGKIIAPGFIDIHSHSDWSILANPEAKSSIHQGVTTEVMGNCGFSFAPTDDPEKIRPLVPVYLRDLVEINWRSFAEYLGEIEQHRPAINVAHLVGHHALRLTAIGFDARPPTPDEQHAMEQALMQALSEGGIGLSFGLEYTPGVNATYDEMLGLARVAAEQGAIVTIHMRNQDGGYIDAINESLNMTRSTGVRLQISHIPPHLGNPLDDWSKALALVEEEIQHGHSVGFDAHPYLWGGTLLTRALPAWAFNGGTEALLARLRDPAARQAMKDDPNKTLRSFETGEWDKFIVTYVKHRREVIGKTLTEIAAEMNYDDPYDAVFDILLNEGEDLFGALWVTELIEPEIQQDILRHPLTIIESDGMTLATDGPLSEVGWHPRCFGWTARLLGEHVREHSLLSLETAIHKMTLKGAERFGINGRGIVQAGAYADLVMFDAQTVNDNANYRQPNQYPAGIEYVLVNGKIAIEAGQETDQRGGKVLRYQAGQGVS